jgi:hypothetical protein
MKSNEIRLARTALLEKSVLGYRRSAAGSERTNGAKVGIDGLNGPARLVRTTDAKVGLPKIRA